jgi:short subunit dehydrogenase-like uncharacterized protein
MLMSAESLLVLFGASGYTGRLTAAEFVRRGIPFIAAGRDRNRLEELCRELQLEHPPVIADPTHPETLPALFASRPKLIINCVGPYTRLGEPVVEMSLQHGAHYLDITGEQEYIARVINRYHARAEDDNLAVIPGCGVEYALGNWAATVAAQGLEPLDEIMVANAIAASRKDISRGSALSVLEVLRKPGLGRRDWETQVRLTASEGRKIKFPEPFGERRGLLAPFGEPLTLPRHLRVKNVKTYLAAGSLLYYTARLSFPLLPFTSELLSLALRPAVKAGGPIPQKRTATAWAVVAEAQSSKGKGRVSLNGQDVYSLTAGILAYCATKILDRDFQSKGVIGPAQAFEPVPALSYLESLGVKVRRT